MALSSLPFETLQYIAVYVGTHRPSLQSFSLASKVCHKASNFIVFQQISITVRDSEGLRRDVDQLTEALSRTDSFHCVRKIIIRGDIKTNVKKAEGYSPQWERSDQLYNLREVLCEPPIYYSAPYAVDDESVIEMFSEEDLAWAPMLDLVQAALQLKDLIYDCLSHFPPSLLRILHERQCRLHHLTFTFWTLLWDVPCPYEMELATSPSLYRVQARCSQRDSYGHDDFNLEAMMELTAGLAPNLKDVIILNLGPARWRKFLRRRESWKGLPGFTRGSGIRGTLTLLSLRGCSRLNNPEVLQNWARHTDFTHLQQLTLGGGFEEQSSGLSGETMAWVTQSQTCLFPRVKILSVYLTRDDMYQDRPHYSEQATAFFQDFNSLEQLSVDGPIDSRIVDTILSYHGSTLTKLSLRPSEGRIQPPVNFNRALRDIPFEFTKSHILKIKAQCPILEELAVPIKRNKSSGSEAEMYGCLAGMKSLRSLFLTLDCSNWRVTRDPEYRPDFNEEDQKLLGGRRVEQSPLTKGLLKEMFINCAVDATLARSIWTTICQRKSGRRLERLKLWTNEVASYGANPNRTPTTFIPMLEDLARSWSIERALRDDKEDITVMELMQDVRMAQEQYRVSYVAKHHDPELLEVFHFIWPAREESRDWRDDWSSFPLQLPSDSSSDVQLAKTDEGE